ncbi:MAG: RidA family protein [Armatimonadetes bacterium]|nr:RidA family protein [Armatimonadota bacterium]
MSRNGKSYTLPDRARPLASYPHLREANGFIFVSGISARQYDGSIRGVGDTAEQTRAVIENLQILLQGVGADLDCLVNITTYLMRMNDYAIYNEAYNDYFDAETGPTRTTVGVDDLPGKQLILEMSAIALKPT